MDKLQLVIRLLPRAAMVRVLSAGKPHTSDLTTVYKDSTQAAWEGSHTYSFPVGATLFPQIKQENALWTLLAHSPVRINHGTQLWLMKCKGLVPSATACGV